MRTLFLCLVSVFVWPLTGCETAWGGSEQSSMAKLKAQEAAQIDQQAETGDISPEEAEAQKASFNQTMNANQAINQEAEQAVPNPAGETTVIPDYN